MHDKIKITGARGCELLHHVESVDPRDAEGLHKSADTPATELELEQELEEQKRNAITDPYQKFLFDARAMRKKGNFKGAQGDTILQRIRLLGESGHKALDLAGFCIRDDFADLLVPYLRTKMCGITMLNIARTQIGIEGVSSIARVVNSNLEALQLSENPLPVASFRMEAQNSRSVRLSGQRYNQLDAAAIGVLVERDCKKLERMDLSDNLLTGVRTNVFHGLGILFSGLKKCSRLKELNLCNVCLRAEGLTELANTVGFLSALEKLDISRNQVTQNSFGDRNGDGVEAFCNELWQAPKLRDISLAENGLDYLSCTAIAKMLMVNQQLRCLDLAHNPLSEAGALQLASGLKKNACLEKLDLCDCEFSCEAIQILSESMSKFNRTLQVLRIRANPDIRSSGYKSLATCLKINPVLQEVDAELPRKYGSLRQKIDSLLVVNKMLTSVRKDFKSFDFESLSEVLRTNFIEKLAELSPEEIQRLCGMHVLEDAEIGKIEGYEATVSSIRYYSQMQQYLPLKRLLWIFDSEARQGELKQRPKLRDAHNNLRKFKGKTAGKAQDDEEDGDEDVWGYPLV